MLLSITNKTVRKVYMDESVEAENDHEQKIKPHSPLVGFSSEVGDKADYHSDV